MALTSGGPSFPFVPEGSVPPCTPRMLVPNLLPPGSAGPAHLRRPRWCPRGRRGDPPERSQPAGGETSVLASQGLGLSAPLLQAFEARLSAAQCELGGREALWVASPLLRPLYLVTLIPSLPLPSTLLWDRWGGRGRPKGLGAVRLSGLPTLLRVPGPSPALICSCFSGAATQGGASARAPGFSRKGAPRRPIPLTCSWRVDADACSLISSSRPF